MAHRLFCLFAAALVMIPITSTAQTPDSRYIAPTIIYMDDDRKRGVDDQLSGFSIAYGQAVAPWWDFEIGLFTQQLDGFNESDQHGLTLDSHLLFNQDRNAGISPYIILGTGFMNTLASRAPDGSDMILTAGVGADWNMKPNVSLRTEARMRRDLSGSQNLDDLLLNAGFKIGLGQPAPPPPVDTDGDGVNDDMDQCPGTPPGTPVDSRGCKVEADSDRDGVPDTRDRCPDTRRGARVNSDGCEPDADGDGVPDARDRCPNSPRGAKVDANGCEFDSDGDGVVDRMDRCPDTPSGTRVDANGCPLLQEIKLEGVFFELNSAQLRPDAVTRLNQAVETLRLNSDLRVEVGGHTDSTGAASYNEDLSQRRAEAVRDYLVGKGISASRLSARGYGESQPAASNDTREGRAENRRVMLKILDVIGN